MAEDTIPRITNRTEIPLFALPETASTLCLHFRWGGVKK